ncbi:MAG: dihydroneopterin aldolase [Actinomycetota bacterium]
MTATLRITGIEVEGRHGASAGEQHQPQRFAVDLEVVVAPVRDELEATADYRAIVTAVRGVVGKETFELLETLAEHIVHAVLAIPGVRSCRATVHKPAAAQRLRTEDVSAEAEGAG